MALPILLPQQPVKHFVMEVKGKEKKFPKLSFSCFGVFIDTIQTFSKLLLFHKILGDIESYGC